MGSSIISLSAIVSAMTLEQRLCAHRRHVMFALLALSIAVRAVYYAELGRGPCLWTHRWTESDNAFFDRWAKDIAGGDWLTDQALHPMVSWNYAIAKMHFARHPEEATGGDESTLATALWNRWYGAKTFHQEPLYAYSIALTYRLFGDDVRWVFLWQMALGVLTNLMLWDLARRYFGETAGALTAVLILFFAPLYYLELTLVRTTLLTFLAVTMWYLAERALDKKSTTAWLYTGIVFGIGMLGQSTLAVFVPGCLAILAWRYRSQLPIALRYSLAILAGTLIGISPAVIRNLSVGAPTFSLASNGAITFIGSFDASATPEMGGGGFNFRRIEQVMDESGARSWPAIQISVASHGSMWKFAWLLGRKFAKYWQWYEEPDNQNFYYFRLYSHILRWSLTLWLLAPLMLVGLVLALPRFERRALLYALAVTGMAMGVIAQPVARYRAGYLAATVPFAAFALVQAATWWRQQQYRRFGVLAAGVAVAFLWTSRPLPAGRPEIRTADYLAPYYFYWIPEHTVAVQGGRWREAAALLQDSLHYQPEDAAQRRELAQAYSQVHAQLAQDLLQCGDTAGAAIETQRAKELEAAR
jgi:4-amino-4-deoxy-L-arabinose transferase-like glycosyltransferase